MKYQFSNSFLKQQSKGNIGENLLIDLFTNHNFICYKEAKFDKRQYYDLVLKNNKWCTTIEVKYDIKSSITQNILIEFCNTNTFQASGITVTQANLWAHIIKYNKHNAIYLTNTDILRSYIESVKPKYIKYKGGDNNSAYLLYDSIILNRIFYRIDNINTKQLNQILYKVDFTYEF